MTILLWIVLLISLFTTFGNDKDTTGTGIIASTCLVLLVLLGNLQ